MHFRIHSLWPQWFPAVGDAYENADKRPAKARERRVGPAAVRWAVSACIFFVLVVASAPAQTVTLTVDKTEVSEGDGATTIQVTAELSSAVSSPTSVTLAVGSGSSARSSDYAISLPLSPIVIAANTTQGSATVSVRPTDDGFYELDESIQISGTSGALTVTPVSITIKDNDTKPELLLKLDGAPWIHFSEGHKKDLTLEVTLTGSSLEASLDVTISLATLDRSQWTVKCPPAPKTNCAT